MNNEFWQWYEEYAEPKLVPPNLNVDRRPTIKKMLEHLDKFENPIIVETGCVNFSRENESTHWAQTGASTIIFDKYAQLNNGIVLSVDIDFDRVFDANKHTSSNTTVYCNNSVDFLKELTVSPHLVYLDSWDVEWHIETEAQVHHYNELKAVLPKITSDTLLVVDDSPALQDDDFSNYEIRGKGGLVAKHLGEICVPIVFHGYQTGWHGFPGKLGVDDDSNEELIFRARRLVEEGKWADAYPLYKSLRLRTCMLQTPKQRVIQGEACAFLARLAVNDQKVGSAYDWYSMALKADPRAVDYRLEFINDVLLNMFAYNKAEIEAYRAVKLEPDNYRAWRTLGQIQQMLGDEEKCLFAHRKAVSLDDSVNTVLNLVGALADVHRYDEADEILKDLYERKVDDPQRADILTFIGMMAARRGNHEEAIELFKKSMEDGCQNQPEAWFHMSLSLTSIGRYKEGFAAQAKRVNTKSYPALSGPMRRFKKPLFNLQQHEPPAVLHIHAESGFGDCFAMMRYFPLLVEKGYKVRFETKPEFHDLAVYNLKDIEVVKQAVDYPGAVGIKEFDYHLPLGEFPYQFGTDIDTIPWNGPYIKADPKTSKKYECHKGRIGLAWSSGIRETNGLWMRRYGKLKSLSFQQVMPFVKFMPDEFVSLQFGVAAEENNLIVSPLPEGAYWDESVALIEHLDLVITPDTGLAHLAGAMGKETWLMMHGYNSGWHFMSERPGAPWNEASPWYPSIKIFRQKTPGDWNSVIFGIRSELKSRYKKIQAGAA